MTKIIFATLLALALISVPACPHPMPGEPTTGERFVDCGKDVIRSQGIALIPAVNTCLVTLGNPAACLLAMVDPVAGITFEMIACMVQSRGAQFNAAAQANPGDQLSKRAATNARTFLNDQGVRFHAVE